MLRSFHIFSNCGVAMADWWSSVFWLSSIFEDWQSHGWRHFFFPYLYIFYKSKAEFCCQTLTRERVLASFIPRHTIVAGYYGFTLDVCVSVCPSVSRTSVRRSVCFSFPDDNLSKLQWIFTRLGMCIDIVDIWFGIANGQILSFYSFLPDTRPYFCFRTITWVNNKGFNLLAICIDIKEIWFGIANGQISSNFYGVICPRRAHILVSRQ